MGSRGEQTGFTKIIALILLTHAVILLMIAIADTFIPVSQIALQGISGDPFALACWTLVSVVWIWTSPHAKHTLVGLSLTVIYEFFSSVMVFFSFYEFSWIVTDLRIFLSIFYILPVFPLLLYVLSVDTVEEEDHAGNELFIEEIFMHDTIEKGLEYVLSYIDDPKWKFESGYKERFLEYISERDDELGELARKRLQPEI